MIEIKDFKRRILVVADSPTVSTGFAQVSRNVLKNLYDSGLYEIDMVGINYDGGWSREDFDNKYYYIDNLIPAMSPQGGDLYGRQLTLDCLAGVHSVLKPPYDILFTIQDHFILGVNSSKSNMSFSNSVKALQKNTMLSKYFDNSFTWIGYFPVDGDLKEQWVTKSIGLADFPVAYCEYGKNQILKFDNDDLNLKDRLSVIRHGTNTDDFYPLSAEERIELRKKYFYKFIKDDTFIITNVNRNQPRKDLVRTLMVFKKFKERVPNSLLYLHCRVDDNGGNLHDYAKFVGLEDGDFLYPKNFNERVGVPINVVNEIYNASDVLITTTLGEGWGLSITEAMSTKLPVVAPNITSIPEILNTVDGFNPNTSRGITFKSGATESEKLSLGVNDNEVIRPISNVDDAVEKLLWVYNNREKTKEIVERAYTWATELTWESEGKKWLEVFFKAIEKNDKIRSGKHLQKLNRNDKCPICETEGRDLKIKKCDKHKDFFLEK